MKQIRRKLLALLLTAVMLLGLLPKLALALDEPAHSHDGWTAITMGTTCIKLGDTEQSSNTLPAGSYYLDGNISVPLLVSGEVSLCLNDHDVSVTGNNSRAIQLAAGAVLNLYDCPGANYGGTALGYTGILNIGGTVHVYGGSVKGESVGIKNDISQSLNTIYIHGGEVNGLYGIQNLASDCTVYVSGGSVTGSSRGIYNTSSGSNKIYLSGTPQIKGNRANGDIYTDGSSSIIYADDGAAENPTPYTGNVINLAYYRLNTSLAQTVVRHVTEENKDKFALIEGHYSHHLEFTKYNSSSTQNDCLIAKGTAYTVVFHSNGGSAVANQTVVCGNTASKPTDPTKDGLVFGGWYSNEELTQAYDFTSSVTNDLTLYAKWSDAPTHTHAVSVDCSATQGDQVEFTAWSTADAMPTEAGNYVLTTDVALTDAWTVPEGITNLCLNGHVLQHTGYNQRTVLAVGQGATLALCDCDTTTQHKFSADANGCWVLDEENGDKTVTGGVITGGTGGTGGGVHVDKGTMVMYGGNIVGNQTDVYGNNSYGGGGVYAVGSAANFTLHGGRISGNFTGSTAGGGGLRASSSATVTITGGEISENTVKKGTYARGNPLGGGVSMGGSAVLNLSGGSIVNNTVTGSNAAGGGVTTVDSTFNLSGGPTISGNAPGDVYLRLVWNNVTPITVTGPLTFTTPIGLSVEAGAQLPQLVVKNGKDYLEKFTCDQADCSLAVSGNDLRLITTPPEHTHDWATAWTTNDTHHWHECTADGCDVTENADKDSYAAHSGGTATCTAKALCAACGQSYGDLAAHDFTGDYLSDADGHWHQCKNCTATDTKTAHVYDNDQDTTCNTCGYTRTVTPPTPGQGDVTGEVEVKGGAPDVTVDEEVLKDLAGTPAEGERITVKLTVEKQDAPTDKADIDAVVTGDKENVLYLDLSLLKQVNDGEAQAITDAARVLEIAVDYDFTGKRDVTVYRKHGDNDAEKLTKLTARPTENFADGSFYADSANGVVYIYASKFSTYAIGYTAEAVTPTPTPIRRPHYTATPAQSPWPFTDVKTTDPGYEAVKYVYEKGWMLGTSDTTFSPQGDLTRAMLAAVLYRAAGSPKAEGAPEFEDTQAGQWYSDAVAWASRTQVLRGYGNGNFGPEDPVSREMLDMVMGRLKGEDPAWAGDPALARPAARAEIAQALMAQDRK